MPMEEDLDILEGQDKESRALLEEAYKAVQQQQDEQNAVMEESEAPIETELKKATVLLDDVVYGEKTLSMNEEARRIQQANQRAARLAIKRQLAMSGDLDLLYRNVPSYVKKMMIPEATKAVKASISALKQRIDRKVTALMEPLIPMKIRLARALCGSMPFKQHPGFMWTSSKMHNNARLWVSPNIPYYFEQFTEMDVIRRYCPAKRIWAVERLVEMYLTYVATLAEKETKLALKLHKIDTYQELLTFNIDMFYLAYSEYKKMKEEEADTLRCEGQDEMADRIENSLIDIEGLEKEVRESHINEYNEKIGAGE